MRRFTMDVINPATNKKIGEVQDFTEEMVRETIGTLEKGFAEWSRSGAAVRSRIMFRAAEIMRSEKDRLASVLTTEQGKPLHEARNEILGAAAVMEFYASVAGTVSGRTLPKADYGYAFTRKTPLGVCGAIIPWNMPALIMAWKVCPALITGNTVVLKTASATPLTNIEMADVLCRAGLPKDALAVVTGKGSTAGAAVAKDERIRHLSFTGSVDTGNEIARMINPGRTRLTLELGGSDPMIVCGDADIDRAVAGAVSGRFFNCGQTCAAVKRLFIADSIADEFISKLKRSTEALRVGDGAAEGTSMGPLNSASGLRDMEGFVESIGNDGCVITGGSRLKGPGNFYRPTLILDPAPGSRLLTEEVFGPVLPIVRFGDLDEAIGMANDSGFGLGASIWTKNLDDAREAVERIDSGIIWINRHLRIPPEVPFGGVKGSGTGRENGLDSLEQYLTEKTVILSP